VVNATGWNAVEGYEVVAGPSVRTVVDLSDPDRTLRLHAPGQSAHPFHRHYTHLADGWAAGEPRRRPFTTEAVEDAAVDRLVLRPGPTGSAG
jgi:penicillin amidase